VPDVFLAGWHSHDDLPDFLRASDVLVHASVNEQFGQVLVEAMACELPTIAVDRAGPAEIVDDPDTGWLVEPDDAAALAAAMVAAIESAMANATAQIEQLHASGMMSDEVYAQATQSMAAASSGAGAAVDAAEVELLRTGESAPATVLEPAQPIGESNPRLL